MASRIAAASKEGMLCLSTQQKGARHVQLTPGGLKGLPEALTMAHGQWHMLCM
jgi:hypothetical protein